MQIFEIKTENIARNKTFYELDYEKRFQEYENEIKTLKAQLRDATKKRNQCISGIQLKSEGDYIFYKFYHEIIYL